jgi:hypothetical protein
LGVSGVDDATLVSIVEAIDRLGDAEVRLANDVSELLEWARSRVSEIGRNEFAAALPFDPANLGKVLRGDRSPSFTLLARMRALALSHGSPTVP